MTSDEIITEINKAISHLSISEARELLEDVASHCESHLDCLPKED